MAKPKTMVVPRKHPARVAPGKRRKLLDTAAAMAVAELAGDRTHEATEKRKLPATFHQPADLAAAMVRAVEAMREHGVLSEASRSSRIGRDVLRRLIMSNKEFKRAMRDAHAECMDELERAMIARGRYAKGDLAGIFVLKHNRAKYREDSLKVEHTGKDGGPILTQEVKQSLADRLTKLADALATDAVVVGDRKGPALVSDGDGVSGVKRVAGSAGSSKPKRGVRVG